MHTASCSLQEVQAVRTLSLSYPAMYPAGSCCNCAPHHPLCVVRPRAPLAHSHSLQAVPSLSLTISSVMSSPRRLVLQTRASRGALPMIPSVRAAAPTFLSSPLPAHPSCLAPSTSLLSRSQHIPPSRSLTTPAPAKPTSVAMELRRPRHLAESFEHAEEKLFTHFAHLLASAKTSPRTRTPAACSGAACSGARSLLRLRV